MIWSGSLILGKGNNKIYKLKRKALRFGHREIYDSTEPICCNYSVPRQLSFPRSAWECLRTAPAVRDARASRSSFPLERGNDRGGVNNYNLLRLPDRITAQPGQIVVSAFSDCSFAALAWANSSAFCFSIRSMRLFRSSINLLVCSDLCLACCLAANSPAANLK